MTDFKVIFMDAGQGDCTLIVYPDHSLTLVDCGSTKSGSFAIEGIKKVIKRQMKLTTNPIVRLVLTHPDIDHYNLVEKLGIKKLQHGAFISYIYYGGNKDHYGGSTGELVDFYVTHQMAQAPALTGEIDSMLSSGDVNVVVLSVNATGNSTSRDGAIVNGNSIVLLVEYLGIKVFLMGDAFIAQEAAIKTLFTSHNKAHWLQKAKNGFTVLKMGHHGSETSTSQQWVQLLTPDVLVSSSGTKGFGPNVKGMPTLKHLNDTMKLCKLEKMHVSFDHTYVVFDETSHQFIMQAPTRDAIWTTAYEVNPEAGRTWSITVKKNQPIEFGGTGL